jgi:hypothetical protein
MPPTRAAAARISLSPDRGHDHDDYRARVTRATFPSDWTIQELQWRKPMVYLVLGGEQVRSLREEKGISQRHSCGGLGRVFEDACGRREKVKPLEGMGS